ncbi:MAG: TonB-dependent receptor plug domain-containing protein [Planctomycetota bacterium]
MCLLLVGLVPTTLAQEQQAGQADEPAPAPTPPPVALAADAPAPDARPLAPNQLGGVLFLDEAIWVEAVSRRRQQVSTAAQAVTVIGYGSEYALPPWTVPDRLRYEAGIDVYQSRHAQFDIGIRGFNGVGTMRTLVVRDGRTVIIDEMGLVPWISHLHLSDIQRIEVIKGPSSVSYGANAFGGVIALAGREPADVHELHGLMDIGQDGLFDIDATALGPLRTPGALPVYYKISAGHSRRDDLDGHRGREPEPHPLAEQSGETDLEATRFSAMLGTEILEDVRLEADYGLVDADSWEMIEDLTIGSNNTSVEDHVFGLRLRAPYGELRWTHREMDRGYSNQKSTFDPVANATQRYLYTRIGFDDAADDVRLQLNQQFGEHYLLGGVEWSRWESDSNFWSGSGVYDDHSTWDTETVRNLAVFAEDQWQPNERWVVNAGIRHDDHGVVGGNTSPRASITFRPDESAFYRLGYSSGYRLPNPYELFIDEFYFAVDEDLEAETVQTVDIGWQKRWRERGSRSILGAFISRADDPTAFWPVDEATMQANWNQWLMEGDFSVTPGPFFTYTNLDKAVTVYGVEGEWRQSLFGGRAQAWTTITWQRLAYDEDVVYHSDGFTDLLGVERFRYHYDLGDEVNAPPEWKATCGVQGTWRGWFGSAALRWVDEQTFFSFASTDFSNASGGPRLALSERDDYIALDLALGYNWGTDAGLRRFIRLNVLDVFDDAHYESYELVGPVLEANNEWQRASEIGRQLALVLGWEF